MVDPIRARSRTSSATSSWACALPQSTIWPVHRSDSWQSSLAQWLRRMGRRLLARGESGTVVLGSGGRIFRERRALGAARAKRSKVASRQARILHGMPADALPRGRRLDRYIIEKVLGQGGFGITYMARSLVSRRRVAIKEYFPRQFATRFDSGTVAPSSQDNEQGFDDGLARFTGEAMVLARFRHPNIVRVRRFFRTNGTAYLVMAYEDGRSLQEILDRTGALEEWQTRQILDPLLDGLAEVHRDGLLHRDIKPENIYVRCNGQPVLLDFGAARDIAAASGIDLSSIYTPGYAPCEQYACAGGQNPATDIYGLGATLYKAITGETPPEALKRTKKDTLVPAAKLAKDRYSADLLAAVDVAMRVENGDRPQSVAAWRTAFG